MVSVFSPLSPARDSPTFLRVTAPSSTSLRVTALCAAADSFCRETTYCSSSLEERRGEESGKKLGQFLYSNTRGQKRAELTSQHKNRGVCM